MTVLAAIDCGTNSTRLLISENGSAVERLMTITRLGHQVDRTGRLDAAAIERVTACLREYRSVMDRAGVSAFRITATSAARDASNSDEFFAAAEAAVGQRPELLSGDEEGRLSFLGATAEVDAAEGPFLVFDIGGGSTEFAFGTNEFVGALSTDMGSVRFTEKYLEHDPPLPEELHACIAVAGDHLDDVDRDLAVVRTAKTAIGLAGTVSTAAAVELGLAAYDREALHHFRLTRAAAEDVFRTLATEAAADRAHNPGLESGRVDIIVGGMCILVKVMRHFDLDEILVSESDILDGLIQSQR